jgi:tetratricopeptide (TPR) repeat protein
MIALALAAGTILVYLPTAWHGFLNYDDDTYITENDHVKAGLTGSGIAWAFQSRQEANWHPLTWVSHMLDCQVYGLHPAGHHLTSILLHTANTVLLFFLLKGLTGATWRSAFVAALFAWHPLRVESVAWAAERKDVLSAFFWLLALLAYARYVSGVEGRGPWQVNSETGTDPEPSPPPHPDAPGSSARRSEAKRRQPRSCLRFYLLALALFACGLMSKPMVVTLPFVLLLIDFWPLRRIELPAIRARSALLLVVEKLPFFALSAASCLITYSVQQRAAWSSGALSMEFRAANALMSYVRYLGKLFWPTNLALIYPYPHHWPLAGVAGAALVLAAVSGVVLWQARRRSYLAVGWFWYLGTLVPAIGLVQVGVQSMADRYSYLPSIGILILVAWGLGDLLGPDRQKARIAGLAAGAALAACLAVTSIQLNYWRNNLTIFWHTIQVTTDNYDAYNCLGPALEAIGKQDEAESLYQASVQVEPTFALGQYHLGMIRLQKGMLADASNHLASAVQYAPNDAFMQCDFGSFLLEQGQPELAAAHFQAALASQPDLAQAHYGLAGVACRRRQFTEAVARYREALRLKPDFLPARKGLEETLAAHPEAR